MARKMHQVGEKKAWRERRKKWSLNQILLLPHENSGNNTTEIKMSDGIV